MKKIAILLIVLLVVQMMLYARVFANEIEKPAEQVPAIEGFQLTAGDHDVDAYLRGLCIQTKVNESALAEKYKGASWVQDPQNGNTTIRFYNPNSNNYRLDIYDVSTGLVASFANVKSDNVVINKILLESGSYIYKLSGESNFFCGTLVIR